MTTKTKEYKLKANANYEGKIIRKTLILRPKDQLLIDAINKDTAGKPNKLNPLIRKLLCGHYGIECANDTDDLGNERKKKTADYLPDDVNKLFDKSKNNGDTITSWPDD